jgi:hypothetical protein
LFPFAANSGAICEHAQRIPAPGDRYGIGNDCMNDIDLTAVSASGLVRKVGAREVTARQVTEAVLARIAQLNPVLNALCTMNEDALTQADAVDARLAGDVIAVRF